MFRDLKDFRWVFTKKQVILINKKLNKKFPMSWAKTDSFVRAYISGKNMQRIEEKKDLRELINRNKDRYMKRVKKLMETITKLRKK